MPLMKLMAEEGPLRGKSQGGVGGGVVVTRLWIAFRYYTINITLKVERD
jgi:hypothetical protein